MSNLELQQQSVGETLSLSLYLLSTVDSLKKMENKQDSDQDLGCVSSRCSYLRPKNHQRAFCPSDNSGNELLDVVVASLTQ